MHHELLWLHSFVEAHAYILSQVMGFFFLVFNVIRFHQTDRKSILLWALPVGLMSILSQSLNNQWQGASLSLASTSSALMQIPFYKKHKTHKGFRIVIGVMFGILGVIICPPTAIWVTWLPLIAYTLGRIGEAMHSFLHMRIVWLFSTTIYIWYNALSHNFLIMITECIILFLSIRFVYAQVKDSVLWKLV